MSDAAHSPLARAVQIVGSQTAAATVVGVTQQYVSDVLRGLRRKGVCPAEWCVPLEEATAAKGETIWRWELRPDLFTRPQSEAA